MLSDSLNARLVVVCVPGIKELTSLATMLLHATKALGFRSKTRSIPWFLPAILSCKLPSGLTKTCSSLEDGVVRIRSSPCLLYRAVRPINVKVLDQE